MSISVWKKVVEFENYYEVSSCGKIRSLDRIDRFGRFYQGRELRQKTTRFGYNEVTFSINGVSKSVKTHRIVAEAFIQNNDNKQQVNHINGIKTDNSLNNLEWVTPMENINHGIKTGLINNNGELNPASKMKIKDVLNIRKKYLSGKYSQRLLAKEYNVSQKSIFNIVNSKKWVKALQNQ